MSTPDPDADDPATTEPSSRSGDRTAVARTAPAADDFSRDAEPAAAPEALPSATTRLAGHVRGEAPRIVANWVLGVANLPAFRAMPDLGLDELRGGIPELLDALLTEVAFAPDEVIPAMQDQADAAARDRGTVRAIAGFSIGAAMTEFLQLRAEIWAAVWRAIDADPSLAPGLRLFEQRLATILDRLMIAATEAWVAARLKRSDHP